MTRTSRIAFSLILGIALLAPAAPAAWAKGKAKASKKAPKANKKAMLALMGDFKWGLSLDEVLAILETQIAARYEEAIKETPDLYEKDRMRKKIKEEVKAIKKTQVAFDGTRTGWDVSIVEREFGQGSGESMVVYDEIDAATGKTQQRFFFFADGKLWKMFIVFNMEVFEGMTFADFKSLMEKRYGRGAVQTKTDAKGEQKMDYIYWRGSGFYLRAIDLTEFYGNFCIAISQDSMEKSLAKRRKASDETTTN